MRLRLRVRGTEEIKVERLTEWRAGEWQNRVGGEIREKRKSLLENRIFDVYKQTGSTQGRRDWTVKSI